jgi:hypothetical protein
MMMMMMKLMVLVVLMVVVVVVVVVMMLMLMLMVAVVSSCAVACDSDYSTSSYLTGISELKLQKRTYQVCVQAHGMAF